jgi:hypothetical protein
MDGGEIWSNVWKQGRERMDRDAIIKWRVHRRIVASSQLYL